MQSNRDYATENIYLKKRLKVLETSVLEYKDQEQLYWQTNENNVKLRQENEKFKKAIEIILNKKVNIRLLLLHNLKDYNFLIGNSYQLTKEEYEFLKEVLGNE